MKVLVISDIATVKGIIPAGETIDITAAVARRLKDKISIVNDQTTEPQLMQMISDSFHKTEQLRSDWSGFRKSLTVGRRDLLAALEKKIDDTYSTGDAKALQNALELHHNFHATICKEFRR